MRTNNILGIVFANVHDNLLPNLTEKRSMASVPFAGRYRLIDFTLSNLTNAGISQVGIITKENYQSLMDHIGSGREWDLDRKSGGLFILPPFVSGGISGGVYNTHLEALSSIMNFLKRAKQDYVAICDSDLIANVDIGEMFRQHIENEADFTIAYKYGKLPKNHEKTMVFSLSDNQRIGKIEYIKERANVDYSLNILLVGRLFLIDLITKAIENGQNSLSKDILVPSLNKYKVMGYKVECFAEVMDEPRTYYELNMKMLDSKIRKQLFSRERPIYTKTHDSMPAKYCIGSNVVNSLIADGSVIEGTVKNSILFRNVTVKKGAVIENAIIMQNAVIEENAKVSYAVMDKISKVSQNGVLEGTKQKIALLKKGETI
ncbi:MAG: glucose-1-phosphate adenylyltransferase subunit GlgD [Acutalibacteraceae bacterium]|nr:glucose-1-phosphate adenylyltransferase subunit GlgD [Acutalibacteraceae bacterium]